MKDGLDQESIENPWEEPTIEEGRRETLAIFVGAVCVIGGALAILFFILLLLA